MIRYLFASFDLSCFFPMLEQNFNIPKILNAYNPNGKDGSIIPGVNSLETVYENIFLQKLHVRIWLRLRFDKKTRLQCKP